MGGRPQTMNFCVIRVDSALDGGKGVKIFNAFEGA